MKPSRSVYVAGGAITPFIGKFHPDFIWKGHPEFGKKENPTIEAMIHQVAQQTLADTDVDGALIDRGVIGNFVGECFVNQGHLGAMLAAADPGFHGKPFHRVEGACASGGLALFSGIEAIACGAADLVLVAGAEVQTTRNAKDGADFLARAAHYEKEREIDPFTFPCMFARRTKAYLNEFGGSLEDLAPVVVKAYENANRNPNAHMREVKMTLEQASKPSDKNPTFLTNEEYKDWLKVSDCSQVSDGACAVLLASPEGLEKLGKGAERAVEIVGYGAAAGPLGEVDDLTTMGVTQAAANQAYVSAGWNATEIQVAEVHDCFSITEVLLTEALGLCPQGTGISFAAEGNTRLDGSIPVNTGGGLMAFGHPVGATGVKQAFEIFRQMNQLCGDYQMPNTPIRGAAANMGGDDRTSVVTLYRKVGA